MDKILAYFLRVSDKGVQYRGYLGEADNSLKAEQEYVGGLIAVMPLTDEIVLIVNDEGKIAGLPYNRVMLVDGRPVDVLAGNIMEVRHEGEEFTSIQPEDVPFVEEHLPPFRGIIGGNILIGSQDSLPQYEGVMKDGD
ncbi:MAG: DUF3846 domain-containing protein [Eubacterium sp.]|nr:DUF3846 domain-containing protein [Eubacterium sp.]